MAMVSIVTVAAYRRIFRLELIGLVQRSAAIWRSCYIHQMNRVNSRNGFAMMTALQTLAFVSLSSLLLNHSTD